MDVRKFTDRERRIFDMLGEACDEYVLLPGGIEEDAKEFDRLIVSMQNIILARVGARCEPHEVRGGPEMIEAISEGDD